MPQVVDMAGGVDALGAPGEPSRRATWDEIEATEPDIAILMPCGFGVERALDEIHVLDSIPQFARLPAVQNDRVYVVDASSYYSRSGPRVVDGIELMAAILHPDVFRGQLRRDAAVRLSAVAGGKSAEVR